MDEIRVNDNVCVPADCIEVRAVRASGPGGQNVNKVSSKVELRVELEGIVGLTESARVRLRSLARKRLDANDRLLVSSQRFRDQPKNLQDARDKIQALIERAMVEPTLRKATRPTRSSVERRMGEKRRRGLLKKDRRTTDE